MAIVPISYTSPNGESKDYQCSNGTYYHHNTPPKVIDILERARMEYKRGRLYRIRLFYGDTKTGRDWLEENNIMGYVGRSTGLIKIPLLIHNRRSTGGHGILDHCIVKITHRRQVIYQHPKYHIGGWTRGKDDHETYPWYFKREGETIARFKTYDESKRFRAFITGESDSK